MGQEIAFPCPECKGSIKLDLRSKSAQDGAAAQTEKLPSGEALKKKILRSVGDLPPMPQTIHKVREIMANPNSSFKDLAGVLETDQAIAARVLKMANSAYYGVSGEVSSIQQASVVLGQKALGELMTMAGASGLLGDNLNGYRLEAGALWLHSLAVAFGSRIVANKKNPDLANDAFAAGLIHDAGKLILDQHIFERKEAFEEFMGNGQHSFLDAEKEILGFDHSEIAAEVCKSWHVPEALAVAIRYHHFPSQSQGNELSYIVHVADAAAMMTGMGAGVDGMSYQMDNKAMERLGLQEADLSDIMVEVTESVDQMAQQVQ
jgi:HD-like signal output (HDOD) protein